MSKDEKLNHIEECKDSSINKEHFYFRLSLAAKEDPEASDMKTRINALTNAFGYNDLFECMDAMIMTLEQAAQRRLTRPK